MQSHPDARELAIDRVGIRNLRYPIRFVDGDDPPQPTIAVCSAYVALPADRKGTHMSRLVAAIDELAEPLSLPTLPDVLDALLARLEADAGRIDIAFPWFIRKSAPVTGVQSMMDYEVRLVADAAPGTRSHRGDDRRAGDEPVSELQGDRRLRRAQPAVASDA